MPATNHATADPQTAELVRIWGCALCLHDLLAGYLERHGKRRTILDPEFIEHDLAGALYAVRWLNVELAAMNLPHPADVTTR